MSMVFSTADRPVHLGPYPLEMLPRQKAVPDLTRLPVQDALAFDPEDPTLTGAMARYQGMMDVIREGAIAKLPAEIPDCPQARAEHLKAAAYFFDASMVGLCRLPSQARRPVPLRNPMVAELAAELAQGQPRSFASGIDMIYADILDAARTPVPDLPEHDHAMVILVEYGRSPKADEAGADWLHGTEAQRAGLLAANTAVMMSSYLRLLGFSARSHTVTCSDVHLDRLAVAAGLAQIELMTEPAPDGHGLPRYVASNPYVGRRFALAAVTMSMTVEVDWPISTEFTVKQYVQALGPGWWLGGAQKKSLLNRDPYARREYRQGAHPFERIPRRDEPTTFIDAERVPRFPKRADFFARALFGDLGKQVQDAAAGGHFILKSPIGACARRALGALLLLQFGDARCAPKPDSQSAQRNSDRIKAAAYYMSVDAVGVCEIPEYAWYSHDAGGNAIAPYHRQAVNLLIDQGFETMEGASGDDWISVAQSMRAYLRFSLLGGVVAEQIRRQGYSARVHSALDGDLLQPPLLLLSGLGEVSRIGEVILNPYLGPRLKSGVVSTDMPLQSDRPIDFGLQRFCESCNKCARECPSGAISAGDKVMYNGYEIWKSDAEKCARYRITNAGGGMCGRCMKTCPWNMEGLLAERVARWVAMKAPSTAPWLARLDDRLKRGSINPVKTWWWDIELDRKTGRYVKAAKTHRRQLQPELRIEAAEQSLAAYPAHLMPQPLPIRQPLNREAGLAAYRQLLSPQVYRARLAAGDTESLVPRLPPPPAEPPVIKVKLARRQELSEDVARYEFVAADGGRLPAFEPGAHVDVVIAPEYQRAYSLAGDAAQSDRYVLAVQREPQGRGGSALMHRVFREGRQVFISRPRNHFPLHEDARRTWLFGGGIGITPMLAMAHRLHQLGRSFSLHYSVSRRHEAAFADELARAPWAAHAHLHISEEGSRADFEALLPSHGEGMQLYACGSAAYMQALFDTAQQLGWPLEALHREYFSVPDQDLPAPRPFSVQLARRQLRLQVEASESLADVLQQAGVPVDVKCGDGLCGVCAVPVLAGEVEHRDHVLGAAQRSNSLLACCSRGIGNSVVLDL